MRYVNCLIFSYVGAECSFLCRIFLKKLTYPGAQAPHGMVQLSPDNGLPGWDRTLDWHVEQRDSVTLVGYRFSDGWARLDSLFSYKPAEGEELPIFSTGMIGQYVHGNEPSLISHIYIIMWVAHGALRSL